jgi:hypothetical protein
MAGGAALVIKAWGMPVLSKDAMHAQQIID